MAKIIIIGQIAKYPLGGVTWDWLNYLLGFKKLGHDVHYFEDGPKWLYNPIENKVTVSDYNVHYLKNVMSTFGFDSNWTYLSRGKTLATSALFGNQKIQEIFQSADAIFNICGSSDMNKLVKDFLIPKNIKRIYVDGDPMINQIKMLKEKNDATSSFRNHDIFFTYAENIGEKDCAIPLQKEIQWIKTRFPVYLPEWKSEVNKKADRFTTVANWQSYKGFLYKGEKYSGAKSIEFLKFKDIPNISKQKLELAIIADTEEKEKVFKKENLQKKLKDKSFITNKNNLEKMKKGGWIIADAIQASEDWKIYRDYIENSKGEWSVAKNIYVKAKTGWFSGRSTCYLASGKPVILEDTGFSKFIPTGKGLFSFKNTEEALHAIEEVNKNYEYHAKEARKIAEQFFNSDIILKDMLLECKL